jgi:ATP-binding cassette, subfamily B (MDR/TAP), member 1
MNFYQPSSGNLLIDGQPIQVLDPEWLRSNVCFVQQESVLFHESVFRNIAFGRQPHSLVTEYEVKMACQTAMLQQTINDLPEGLQTMIGKSGNSLSGGQKQRVAIARARLHDAPILILDEATSALDQINRSLVMEAIREWRRGKTTIVITHDVSEIKDKDYVYVLDGGKVIQEGYRQRLLEDKEGIFASFLSVESDGDQYPLSDEWTITSPMKSIKPHGCKTSIPDSRITNKPDDDWLQKRSRRNRLHRVSQFFGLNEQFSGGGPGKNSRIPRGIVVGSTYSNILYMENPWEPENIPSFSRPLNTKISKPLPNRPSHRESRWPYPSKLSISYDDSVDLDMLDKRGKSSWRSRSQTAGLRRRSHFTTNIGSNGNIVSYFIRGRMSEHGPIMSRNPPSKHQREAKLTQILRTVWPNLLVGDRITLILGFASAFISATATPAFSYVLARLLGTFTSGQTGAAETLAIAILAIALVDGTSSYYMHYFLESCGQTWVDTLRVEALKRILAQPKAWFEKPKNNPKHLSKCLDRNAEEMRNIVGRFAGYVFLAGSMMSIAIVWAFIVCWKLTLVGLASGPCMYAFTRAFEAVSGKWEKRLNDMSDAIGDIFAEAFSDIKVVRALTLENYFKEKHTQAITNAYNTGMHRAAYTSIFFGLSDSTNSFVTALILYYGAFIAASGDWSVESILQVITLLLFSSGNANSVIAFIPQISASSVTATEMLRLANMPRTASHESQGTIHLPSPLPIHLNALSFALPTRPSLKILNGVSVSFEPGTCTAIVGPSGSGKSTIASLLLGLQPPTEPLHTTQPSLTFAGISVFSCNITALRSQISLVTQSPVLFPTSIASNIAYGIPTHSPLLTPHNIQNAAEAAGIHDFIMGLPDGYNTRIGDGARGLSGGQAQRLCIARALVRRPKVLVLDEPTSALDGESAGVIRDTVARLTRNESIRKDSWSRGIVNRDMGTCEGMAVILITHSIDMMRIAQRIIVLEQGRIVQEGLFEDLARRRGPFSKLISGAEWRDRGSLEGIPQ